MDENIRNVRSYKKTPVIAVPEIPEYFKHLLPSMSTSSLLSSPTDLQESPSTMLLLPLGTAFMTIRAFLHGRFPTSISVVGLTATLEPGSSVISVCKSLGFFEGNFKFIRRSNERPNTQFTIQFITHGLNGKKFASIPSCWKESNRGWLEDPLIRTSKGE